MKMKNRILIDISMAIVLVLCMKYRFTGNLLHEIFGVLILIGFVFHIIINHRYFKSLLVKNGLKNRSLKQKVSLIINTMLLLAVPVMMISSVIISKSIFNFINFDIGHHRIWRTLHILSAVIILICSFVHVLLHMPLFKEIIRKKFDGQFFEKAWGVVSRVAAVLMSIFVLITSVDVSGSITGMGGHNEHRRRYREHDYNINEYMDKGIDEDDEKDKDFFSEEDDSDSSVDEYLSSLTCNGCGKRCSLLSPRCMTGENQATKAKETYYSEHESTH